MNSSVEDRLRGALAEAGETVQVETIAPLRGGRRSRVRPRWIATGIAVAVGVMLAVITAPLLPDGDGPSVAVAPPRDQADLAVYLCRIAADPQCDADERVVENALRGIPGVDEVHFEDRRSAYEAMRAFYSDDPSLVEGITPDDLPQAFRLVTRPGADIESISRQVGQVPGVAEVVALGELKAALSDADMELSVFLCTSERERCGGKTASVAQKAAVSRALAALPEVQSVTFEDQEAAFENFRESFAHNEALVSATRMSDMPESYRAVLRPGTEFRTRRELAAELGRMPGVSQVIDQKCLLAEHALHARFGIRADAIEACE
ncbi:permease-like cell division protein FtsX [Nonomuraea sp. C10]|uniref:permease-like cell division protein FtsX n=1 Tax=Nonomuraea sp. C10 TaxID=2600577 RepID=UPI0011CE1DDE|nr:permease-like cell division protein FtsX [Nonomuraea sp. C10]TXK34660.1 hypothetical protein FR742_35590 [Nonomuraea sp. C10]